MRAATLCEEQEALGHREKGMKFPVSPRGRPHILALLPWSWGRLEGGRWRAMECKDGSGALHLVCPCLDRLRPGQTQQGRDSGHC